MLADRDAEGTRMARDPVALPSDEGQRPEEAPQTRELLRRGAPAGPRWRSRLDSVRVPAEYHVAEFTPDDLDDVVGLFRATFRRDVPFERVRRGLAYRYVDNPLTGHPATAPLLARLRGPRGPLIGFFGCLPTPVRFRGQEKVAGFPMDLFIRDDFQPRRLGLVLLRALLARTRDVLFTSSAGPATQAMLRFYSVVPLPQFQRQWSLPAARARGAPPPSARPSGFLRRFRPTRAPALVPLGAVTDEMAALAALTTDDATYAVERTTSYLGWRFGPLVRAAAPECEVLALAEGGRSLGWIVVRWRDAVCEVLDWLVPRTRHVEALGLVGARACDRGAETLTGRGMQAALRTAALAAGAVETSEMMLYWTWAPDLAVFEGMDWDRAYLSATDGDLTLPWNLAP